MAAEAMTEEGMNEALYAAAEAGDAAEVASLLDSGASANQQHNVSFLGARTRCASTRRHEECGPPPRARPLTLTCEASWARCLTG